MASDPRRPPPISSSGSARTTGCSTRSTTDHRETHHDRNTLHRMLALRCGEADPSRDTAVAWVNCQLFNFKHELRAGPYGFSMWPDAPANPIGTVAHTSTTSSRPTLTTLCGCRNMCSKLDSQRTGSVYAISNVPIAGRLSDTCNVWYGRGPATVLLTDKISPVVLQNRRRSNPHPTAHRSD